MANWIVGMPVAYPAKSRGVNPAPYAETTVAKVGTKQGTLANDQKFMLESGKLVGRNEYRHVLDLTVQHNIDRVERAKQAYDESSQRMARRQRLRLLIQRMGCTGRYEHLDDDQLVMVADAIETALGEVCDA